jgi:post-segregation antitoxin (ccd killing protein)
MTNNDRSLLESQTAQNTQLTPAEELLAKAKALHYDVSHGTGTNINERTTELMIACRQKSVEQAEYMAKTDQWLDEFNQDIVNKRKALEMQTPTENTSFQRLVNDWCNAVGASTSLAWRRLLNLTRGAI